jgi:hypothetical protein
VTFLVPSDYSLYSCSKPVSGQHVEEHAGEEEQAQEAVAVEKCYLTAREIRRAN